MNSVSTKHCFICKQIIRGNLVEAYCNYYLLTHVYNFNIVKNKMTKKKKKKPLYYRMRLPESNLTVPC